MTPKERYQLRLQELQSSASTTSGTLDAVTHVHATLEMAFLIAESVMGSSNVDTTLVLGVYDRLSEAQAKRRRSLLDDENNDSR